jgi:hypothetical protein
LKAAVTAAGAAATPGLAQAHSVGQTQSNAHQTVPSDLELRVKSLESLLVEKGLVDRKALDALIDTYEHKIGPRNGARVVARAWVDPAYKQRLTLLCVRSAPVIRGRCSDYRRSGTSPPRTGHAP